MKGSFWIEGGARTLAALLAAMLLLSLLPMGVGATAAQSESYAAATSFDDVLARLNADAARRYLGSDGVRITEPQRREIEAYLREQGVVSESRGAYDNLYHAYIWIRDHIAYGEADNDPYAVFVDRRAVCQGMANLFKVFATICEVPCFVLEGDTDFGAHAWNAVYLDGAWLMCDVTNGRWCEPKEQPYFRQSYRVMSAVPPLLRDDDFLYYFQKDMTGMGGISVGVVSDAARVTLPSHVFGLAVNALMPSRLLETNTTLCSVRVPESVVYVDGQYLRAYRALSDMEWASADRYRFSDGVLYNAAGEPIGIPVGVSQVRLCGSPRILKNTVVDLPNLTCIEFGEGVGAIESFAVERCDRLREIILPQTVESIAQDAFPNGEITIVSNGASARAFAERNGYDFRYDLADCTTEYVYQNGTAVVDVRLVRTSEKVGETVYADLSVIKEGYRYDAEASENIDRVSVVRGIENKMRVVCRPVAEVGASFAWIALAASLGAALLIAVGAFVWTKRAAARKGDRGESAFCCVT